MRYAIQFPAVVIFILIQITSGLCGQYTASDSDSVSSDTSIFPAKKPAREKWEYVVAAPLWVATSPLYLTYRFLGGTVAFFDNHHVPETIERILVSEDGTRHIEPFYSSVTGLGLSFRKHGLTGDSSRLQIAGSYGTQSRHGIETELRSIPTPVKRCFLDVHCSYNYVPDEPFFGIGPQNRKSDLEYFSYKDIISFISLRYQFPSVLHMYLAGTVDYYATANPYEYTSTTSTAQPGHALDFGLSRKIAMGGGVIGLDIDTRDAKGRTRKGLLLKAHALASHEITSGIFHDESRLISAGLYKGTIDMSQYVSMPGAKGRVLILRAAAQKIEPMYDREIPVYLLSTLGGDNSIRGFSRGRFRDNDYLILSTEYRYPIWWDYPFCVDAALFLDAGQVAHDMIREFAGSNFHYGFGGGIRLYNHDELTSALYFGFSRDDYRVEFQLGEDSLTRLLNVIKKLTNI